MSATEMNSFNHFLRRSLVESNNCFTTWAEGGVLACISFDKVDTLSSYCSYSSSSTKEVFIDDLSGLACDVAAAAATITFGIVTLVLFLLLFR